LFVVLFSFFIIYVNACALVSLYHSSVPTSVTAVTKCWIQVLGAGCLNPVLELENQYLPSHPCWLITVV